MEKVVALSAAKFSRLTLAKEIRFKYISDHLFIFSVAVYLLNRWVMKPLALHHTAFFSSYFNDLICIPFWLPIVLLITRKVGLRNHDEPPDIYELCFYLLIWSVIFEIVCPMQGALFNYTVSDPWDIVCYCVGTVVGGLYWNFRIARK